MALVTLQTLFQDAFPAYEHTHHRAASASRARHYASAGQAPWVVISRRAPTAALLGSGTIRAATGPVRSARLRPAWLVLQRARLLACDHSHVIFTLPHDLNPLWLANVPVMTTLLLQAVRETLSTLLTDPKYLGAQPGIIAALHTWSQTLVLHPHVHCLVTGGELTADGSWKAVRNGFLLPARVVMAVCRGKMLDAIRRAWTCGEL